MGVLTLVIMSLAAAAAAFAREAPDPGDLPEFFAGTWTVKGRETTFSEKCEWLSPNSYLICNGADTDPKEPSRWITLLGYSHDKQTYDFTAFDGGGGKASLSGWLRGGVWVFTANQEEGTETVRLQVTLTPTKDGYQLREESSVNGAPWTVTLEEEHVRLGPAAR